MTAALVTDVPWAEVRAWAGAALLLVGVVFTLVAAVGVVRLPDLYQRMHAATKPQLLGLMFVCAGIVVSTWTWHWLVLAMVVLGLQVVTAPVGSHLMSQAVYRIDGGVVRPSPDGGRATPVSGQDRENEAEGGHPDHV